MAVERRNRLLDRHLISCEPQGEQVDQRKDDKRLGGIDARKHQVQLINISRDFLGQLSGIGIDRHLIEPDVTVNITRNHTDVAIARIGHAVIAQESLYRLITENVS